VTPVGKPVPLREEGSVHMATNPPSNLPNDMSDVVFLTIAEVAAKRRVSKMTVYRLVHGGDLPAVRVGRSFRVTEEDVNEYIRRSFYNAG